MKRIKDIIKKKDLDVILLIITLVSGASLFVLVNCYDELWNFANAYKMFNGYKIYEELNVIITPLFFYIAQIFFRIFGGTILSFRIYNIVISSLFLILIYLIFKSLKIVRRRAIFYTFIIDFILSSMIAAGANYNVLALIPILIAIILILKEKDNPFLIGILLFITFMIKQNIYIYFAIGIFIYKLINRQSIKNLFKDLFKIYLVSLFCILIFFIYLYTDNNLYNFINYCFLGINEFGIKNLCLSFYDVRYLYISIIAIIFSLFIIYSKKIKNNIEREVIKNVKCLLSMGIPLLLISYPIFNYYHTVLGSIILIIEFIYLIENILIKNMQIKIKKEKIMYSVLIIFYIIYLYRAIAIGIIGIHKEEILLNCNDIFYGSMISKQDYENSQIICNYIKEQAVNNIDVKVLSYKANLYMMQLNKSNELFDLAFLGNLGRGGEEGFINKIKELNNTLILLESDSEKVFGQESQKAREYIINNYEKIGEIQEYSIYKLGVNNEKNI